MDEAYEKCAYCESKIRHVYVGDVEHIMPKSRFPRLRLQYRNLAYACWQCNSAKGDFYDGTQPLLDPYEDDAPIHFYGLGSVIVPMPGATKADTTALILKLNRAELIERRETRLGHIRGLADKYVRLPVGVAKEAVKEQLAEEASPASEYSFLVRELLRSMRIQLD